MIVSLLLAATLAAQAPAAVSPSAPAPATRPATIPGAVMFDLPSKITGRTYRIYVQKPLLPPPLSGYPAVYVLDGDMAFATAGATMTVGQLGGLRPGLIVGVAYPDATALQTMKLRNRDLTPTEPSGETGALVKAVGPGEWGGGEGFYRFLTEELRPVIEGGWRTDPSDRSLVGYSLGGLFTLGALFKHPSDFHTYVAGSPSIWWNDREVLRGEAVFARALRAGGAAPRVLITSAGWEQDVRSVPPGPSHDEDVRNTLAARMVDNARELAERLKALPAAKPGYTVRYAVFPEETHNSGGAAAAARGVSFALERAPQ